MAVVGIDLQNENLDEVAENVRLLRSLLPDGKVALVAENDKGVDLQRILALSPDACIFNLGSRDALIKILELMFVDFDQRVFVFANSIDTTEEEDVEFTNRDSDSQSGINGHSLSPPTAWGSQSDDSCRRGINGHGLSPREAEILTSLALGHSNKAIALLHKLSEATVKAHLKTILRKLKVHNRTQAAIWAIQHIADSSPPYPDRIARAADTVVR